MKNKLLVFSVVALSLAVLFTAGAVLGQSERNGVWVPPIKQFPEGNTTPPLDVGDQLQTKSGDLGVKTLNTTLAGGPAIILQPSSLLLSSDGKSFSPSVSGYSQLFNSTGPFLVNTIGLVVPNKSTSEINTKLGTSIPVGTITYNNGDLWLFTGGTNCQQGGGESFIPPANAQAGRCWVKVTGGTIINNYSSSSIAGAGVWLPGRGGIYTTSTATSIGADNGVKFNAVVSGNGVDLIVASPQGSGGSFNDLLKKAEAQQGQNATAFTITTAGAVSVPNALTAQKTLTVGQTLTAQGALIAQNTLTAQGVLTAQNTINAQGANGISVAPQNVQPYAIKNNSGTIGLYPNNAQNAIFSVGQDGVVLVKDKVAAQGTTLQVVGSSGSESVLKVGGTYGGTFRPGRVEIAHPNGTDTISLKQEYSKTLSISEPGNNKTLKIDLDKLLPGNSCIDAFSVKKYLTVDANGWLVCADLPNSSPTVQIFPAPGSDPLAGDNMMNLEGNWSLCSLSWMESTGGPSGSPFRPTGCEVGKNGSNWYLRAIKNGEWNARCKATCVRF